MDDGLIRATIDTLDEFLLDVYDVHGLLLDSVKVDTPDDKEWFREENLYAAAIQRDLEIAAKKATNRSVMYLNATGADMQVSRAIARLENILKMEMGMELDRAMKTHVRIYVKKLFRRGQKRISVKPVLGVPERRAIRFLERTDNFYVGKVFPEYREEITKHIRDLLLESGLGPREVAKEIQRTLAPKIMEKFQRYDNVVRTSANRCRNWGSVYSLQELGVIYFQVVTVADERRSDICAAMDGHIFSVQRAYDKIQRIVASDEVDLPKQSPFMTPNLAKDLSEGRVSAEELQAEYGIDAPPYHGRCRSSMQMWSETGRTVT